MEGIEVADCGKSQEIVRCDGNKQWDCYAEDIHKQNHKPGHTYIRILKAPAYPQVYATTENASKFSPVKRGL